MTDDYGYHADLAVLCGDWGDAVRDITSHFAGTEFRAVWYADVLYLGAVDTWPPGTIMQYVYDRHYADRVLLPVAQGD